MVTTKKKTKSSKKKKKTRRQNEADLDEVIYQADLAMETDSVEQALQLYQNAAFTLRNKIEADSYATNLMLVKVLGKMGEATVSMGDQDGGRMLFNDALSILESSNPPEVNTSTGPSHQLLEIMKWKEAQASMCMYLGQLSSGNEALEYFNNAVDYFKIMLEAPEGNSIGKSIEGDTVDGTSKSVLIETRRQLYAAHCSISELYVTDLCYEADAENKCESCLKDAFQLFDKESKPDAAQAMANLRLSQNRGLEAMSYILNVFDQMKEAVCAMANLVGLESSELRTTMNGSSEQSEKNDTEAKAKELKDEILDAADNLPGFEFRCQTAKILLECASVLDQKEKSDTGDQSISHPKFNMEEIINQKANCVEAAIQVLGSLLAENDEVVEIWFLLGCAFSSTSPKNNEASTYYWENALKMLCKIKEDMENGLAMSGDSDQEKESIEIEMADINVKIKEVKQKLSDGTGEITMDEG